MKTFTTKTGTSAEFGISHAGLRIATWDQSAGSFADTVARQCVILHDNQNPIPVEVAVIKNLAMLFSTPTTPYIYHVATKLQLIISEGVESTPWVQHCDSQSVSHSVDPQGVGHSLWHRLESSSIVKKMKSSAAAILRDLLFNPGLSCF